MPNNGTSCIVSIKRFKPNLFHLEQGEMISSEVGFTSSSRFYDYFVRSVGVTPLEWRMQSIQ